MTVIGDADALIALAIEKDSLHLRANAISRKLDENNIYNRGRENKNQKRRFWRL